MVDTTSKGSYYFDSVVEMCETLRPHLPELIAHIDVKDSTAIVGV